MQKSYNAAPASGESSCDEVDTEFKDCLSPNEVVNQEYGDSDIEI